MKVKEAIKLIEKDGWLLFTSPFLFFVSNGQGLTNLKCFSAFLDALKAFPIFNTVSKLIIICF